MTTSKQLIYVSQHSDALKQAFLRLSPETIDEYNLQFFDFTNESHLGDDSILVGEDIFVILATSDNRFFIESCRGDPTELWDDIAEKAIIALEDLEAGVPIEMVVPQVKITTSFKYGKYIDDPDDVIQLAITWLRLPVEDYPKEYNPPIYTPR